MFAVVRSSSSVMTPSLKNVRRLAPTGLNGNQKRLTFNHRCLHGMFAMTRGHCCLL
jgi:hypothetical protein